MTDANAVDPMKTQAYLDDRKHVFHSWSAQGSLTPLVVTSGEGSYFFTEDGSKYLDFSSQLVNVNIGHQHPKLVEAIKRQADELCTIAPFHANPVRSEAARLIAELAPGDLNMVFFTNGGAEATDNAIRMARLYTGRQKVMATYRSYHGATGGAIAVTGDPRRWSGETGVAGIVHFWGPFTYRSQFHSQDDAQETQRALSHLRDTIMVEGPSTIAAIILETVVGTNGILVPPPGYMQGVREICDEFGIIYIADEVMAGFGRCGEWFAIDHFGVVPDLITFAKGSNSGYVPIGGVIISDKISSFFKDRPYPGGLTYSGHVLGCASVVASIGIFKEEGIIDYARNLGTNVIAPGLAALQAKHPSVGQVRGMGAFWGLDLVTNRETRNPLVPFNAAGPDAAPMAQVVGACKKLGLWPMAHFNRLYVVPPINTSPDDMAKGFAILDEALNEADKYYKD